MTLVSDSEMAALRGLAESGMTTTVSVYHLVTTAGDNGRVAAYPATAAFTVSGWITEITPNSAGVDVHAGEIGIIETHILRVPVGTDLRSQDKVVSGSSVFIVQRTNVENTYLPMLSAAMRLFE